MYRICHVQVLPILSGVQRSMLEIFKQIDRERYDIHVACQGAGPLTDQLDRLQIEWHAVPALDRPIHPTRDWRAYCDLYRLFHDYRFDVVHTHSSKPGLLGRVAARRAGVPTVIHHVRGYAFHEHSPRWKWALYGRLERWAGRYCDRVLFVNQEERDLSIRRGLLPAEKCQTIYNGVDLDLVDPIRGGAARRGLRAQWRLAADEVAIMFVGRLEYPKQPMMIPAIAAALRQLRPDARWRLLVAGDGPEADQVQRAIDQQHLTDRVQLLGWQLDPYAALHAADVVLLTSLAEGLPRALIEAQGAGRPIVAGNAKGVREVVTPETGFLCSPSDAEDFADKLALLVDSEALRDRLGRAARSHAEEKFDTVVVSRQVAQVYDQFVEPDGESSVPANQWSVNNFSGTGTEPENVVGEAA
ncbi:MAG TPA: glycosyltransferase family 4 protein [Pirellulales bacterium]|jgi:glycosyltransferase involved in cell wall biosynthesis|nr:glycosyltransferase family 4 protein [Pirellulales bacterium]